MVSFSWRYLSLLAECVSLSLRVFVGGGGALPLLVVSVSRLCRFLWTVQYLAGSGWGKGRLSRSGVCLCGPCLSVSGVYLFLWRRLSLSVGGIYRVIILKRLR